MNAVMRMWSFGARRLRSTVRLTSRTFRQPCRPAAAVAGSLIVSRAGFTPLRRFFSEKLQPSVLQAIQAVQNHSSKTVLVASEKESGAFFLLCPPVLDEFDSKLPNKTANCIQNVIKNDLSGVTDLVDCTFKLETGYIEMKAYKTHDVWLVAEFVEQVSNTCPEAILVVTGTAQDAIKSRWNIRDEKRCPIPEVDAIRNPELPLYPHQLEGVRFFMENNGRGLLGDSMGLGKVRLQRAYQECTFLIDLSYSLTITPVCGERLGHALLTLLANRNVLSW